MRIHVPVYCASCSGMCTDSMLREQLNAFSCDINRVLSEAANCWAIGRVVHKVQ